MCDYDHSLQDFLKEEGRTTEELFSDMKVHRLLHVNVRTYYGCNLFAGWYQEGDATYSRLSVTWASSQLEKR